MIENQLGVSKTGQILRNDQTINSTFFSPGACFLRRPSGSVTAAIYSMAPQRSDDTLFGFGEAITGGLVQGCASLAR